MRKGETYSQYIHLHQATPLSMDMVVPKWDLPRMNLPTNGVVHLEAAYSVHKSVLPQFLIPSVERLLLTRGTFPLN